jgi:hypothetical protein
MTSGTITKYAGCIDVRNNRTDKYTENRTTAFSALGTLIVGVGTNTYHKFPENNTLGSEYQNGSLISYLP